jgi:hypothetical protein
MELLWRFQQQRQARHLQQQELGRPSVALAWATARCCAVGRKLLAVVPEVLAAVAAVSACWKTMQLWQQQQQQQADLTSQLATVTVTFTVTSWAMTAAEAAV